MKLDALREYVTLVKHCNFTTAGAELYLSQPSLSTHISQMEKELGFDLLDRTKNAFSVTPAGLVFLDYAQKMLALYEEALEECATMARSVQPVLVQRVSKESDFFKYLNAVAGRPFNFVELGIETSSFTALEKGLIDLGVSDDYSDIPAIKQDAEARGIAYLGLGKNRVALSMMKSHPLASKPQLTRADLQGATVVINSGAWFDSYQDIIKQLLGADSKLKFKLNPVACYANLTLVDFGECVHICGRESTMEHLAGRSDIVCFEQLDGVDLSIAGGLVYLAKNQRAAEFAQAVKQVATKMAAGGGMEPAA